jgi:hypothetical protein
MNEKATRRQFLATTATAAAAIACHDRWLEADQPKPAGKQVFRAGAYAIDITPQKLPVIVSGGFLEASANRVNDRLHARCLVLDDGASRAAIVAVDSCVLPRELLDRAKELAQQATGIPAERITIAAVHTHSAPSAMAILGSRADEAYVQYLPGRIAEGIATAVKNLAPAKVGWTVVRDPQHTNCRRWIRRPDRISADPFGKTTVRAMMHPGYQNPDYVGPAGPIDPYLTILAVQSPEGRPVAVLANYSMHYFGAAPLSADYYGRFCTRFAARIGAENLNPAFVAIMSQGTAGDLHWMDYSQARKNIGIDAYADQVAQVAEEAYKTIQYHDWAPVVMAEKKLTLDRRVPDDERLAWARGIADSMKDRRPKSLPEVYAQEQLLLHAEPRRELRIQAIRVGDLGITAMPCEVFGITGLKIKAQSPLQPTMNLELANGEEGYIPPPEQHKLGGYTTWPARSAGLEVQAEPKIVEAVVALLEEVSGRPRRPVVESRGPYVDAVLASKPLAYWRLGEFAGPEAKNASPHGGPAVYEDGIAFYLNGPEGTGFCNPDQTSRAAHFAGGRLKGPVADLDGVYTFEAWFWNGLPTGARPVTGYLFSRGSEGAASDSLGIGGTDGAAGKLFVSGGDSATRLAGTTELPLKTWNHVALVRDGKNVTVYLNGNTRPEIAGEATSADKLDAKQVFVGGRSDGAFSFEGKIAEVAVYGRALSADEIARHYAAAGIKK